MASVAAPLRWRITSLPLWRSGRHRRFRAPFVYRDGAHALAATDRPAPRSCGFNERLIEGGDMQSSAAFPRRAPDDRQSEVLSPDSRASLRGCPFSLTSMVTGFGAIPTPVEVSELPTALMTGMVIGQENPLTMINANKLYEVQTHVMLTGHMQNVLPVFINESVWQSINEEDQEAILAVLDEIAQETLANATQAEKDLIGELEGKGLTFITEEDGLDIEAFRESVLAQVNADFPTWGPYMERIAAVE